MLPDPGRRTVHPLDQPMDGRDPGPEPAAQPVPRRQPGQRPGRCHLRLRAGDQAGALPRPDQRAALRLQPGGNGMLSVAVEDVAPDGTVKRLTGGWQVISHRALDTKKSRYLGGKLIQAFHPFTKAAEKPLAAGAVEPSTSRCSRPAPRSSRGTGCGSPSRPSTYPTCPDPAPASRLAAADDHPQLEAVPVRADDPRGPLARNRRPAGCV